MPALLSMSLGSKSSYSLVTSYANGGNVVLSRYFTENNTLTQFTVDRTNSIVDHWLTSGRLIKNILNEPQTVSDAFVWGVCFDGRLAARLWNQASVKNLHGLAATFCAQNQSKILFKRLNFALLNSDNLLVLFMHALRMGWSQHAQRALPYVIKNDGFHLGRWVNYALGKPEMKKPMVKKIWTELLNAHMPNSRAEIVGVGLIVGCKYDFNCTDFQALDDLTEIGLPQKNAFNSYIEMYEKNSQRQRILKQMPRKRVQRVKKI